MSGDMFSAVEIFSGGGGLAVGLREAGFNTVAAVELEPHAAATFKANHPTVQVFRQDVRTVTGAMLAPLAGGRVDVLAACPPCQGFSTLPSKWRKEDERNALVSEVARDERCSSTEAMTLARQRYPEAFSAYQAA
jgi:DNA (cytosine-5)-methyltransferase 1